MIPYLNWSIIYASISLQAGYGLIKMNMGSLQQRREGGEEHLYNTIYGVVLLVVFYVIYAKLGTICGAIAASLGIRSISDPVIIFNSLFTSISSTLEGLYLSIIALDAAIVTSPLGVYLSQSTQYFQWMAQLALSNAWLFYVLSRIGEYSPELAGLGFNLVILRQTRTWGGAYCWPLQ